MAISATLELRETPGSFASTVYGVIFKAYSIVDLDYTLKRDFDKTGRPCSGVKIDVLTVTVRGTKEVTAKFHEWIKGDDKLMDGSIKIYDSTGYGSALAQDFTGGETVDYLGDADDLISAQIEDNTNAAMDAASQYRKEKASDDIFDEMSRKELMNYIESKGLDVKTSSSDSDDTIRERIRYYNKISKMSYDELMKEAKKKKVSPKEKATKEVLLQKLVEYNNEQEAESEKKNPAEESAYSTADKLKKTTSKTLSSGAKTVTKSILESARSITFKNAYCVSLREHFEGDPDNDGKINSSYPWLIEIGIKPGILVVNGWNVAGGSKCDVQFDFIK